MTDREMFDMHDHTFLNVDTVKASHRAGCIYCCQVFDAASVTDWTDSGRTALCPLCGVDAVLPDVAGEFATDTTALHEMYAYWFDAPKEGSRE